MEMDAAGEVQAMSQIEGRKLPTDIVMEIMKRLPIKPLLRFKCVSKPWYELLTKNPHFSQLHLQSIKATNPSPSPGIIVVRKRKPQFTDFYFAPDYESFDRAIHLPLPFHRSDYRVIGVCNGLVCLTNHFSIYLWNPLTNVYTTISCPPIPPIFSEEGLDKITVYGFGYDQVHSDYKVIRIISTIQDSHSSVHTVGIPGWRTLNASSYYIFPQDHHNQYPAVVNGAIFWIGAEPVSKDKEIIVSFELTRETFHVIQPPSLTHTSKFPHDIRVGELNESLCVFNLRRSHGVDIWVQDANGFWMKTFIIKKSMVKGTVYSMLPLNGGSNRGVVIKQCDRLFYLFSPTSNSIRKLPKFKFEASSAYTLFGTLISPKELEKNKLKCKRDEIEDAEAA